MENSPYQPLTQRQYVVPLILVTTLFFLWAVGVNLNDILIPHLKKAFQLTDLQSSLIQTAFFGGYFLAALPAGRLMERVGYRKGILSGLLICASGALLVIPAASLRWYGFFLVALFVIACGQSFLEVAANPCVTILGPPESAERRLNLAQSFNSVGAVITPVLGSAFILTNSGYTPSDPAAIQQLQPYLASEASRVKGPYLWIAAIFLILAAVISFTRLPDIQKPEAGHAALRDVWKYRHLVRGVIAQLLYVGAQVGVASFVIRFAEYLAPGMPDKTASNYLKLHLLGFMIGRFAGSALMKYIAPARLLALFATGALLCVASAVSLPGMAPIWAIAFAGFFHSIMFPTIFSLSIKSLGTFTKLGSSFLVMAIIGGAVVPALMGYISDAANIQRAFIVPLACYVYVLYFSVKGYKVNETIASKGETVPARI